MTSLNNRLKTIALAVSVVFAGNAFSQEEFSSFLFEQDEYLSADELRQPDFSPSTSKDDNEPVQGESRFVERKGTARSEAVSQAANTILPQDIENTLLSVEKARDAGGIAMPDAVSDISLPGLKRDDPSLKPWVLHTRNGVNEMIPLSSGFINRISTPFKNPVIVDSSGSSSTTIGGDIFFIPAGKNPVGIFILDGDSRSQVISLTVVPTANIPAQNVIVKMEDLRAAEDLAPDAKNSKNFSSDYMGYLKSMMTQAIRGSVAGYNLVPLEAGVTMIGDLVVTPDVVFSGAQQDIYRYKIKNSGGESIELSESAFFRKGIRAISFFPKTNLSSDGETYIFLLADKAVAGGK